MSRLTKLRYTIELVPKLGLGNVVYMIWYRLSLKLSIRKRWFPIQELSQGNYFRPVEKLAEGYKDDWRKACIAKADEILNDDFTYFSYHKFKVLENRWTSNPFDGSAIPDNTIHWTEMGDFDLPIGDVKIVWELSRFDWLTDLARAYKVSGEAQYLSKINELLQDWAKHNPLNVGVNWKCGQEASFRLMKLMTTAMILDQLNTPSIVLKELIYAHLKRIEPNIQYAIAQDNNHGTSEAAALYIGSAFLSQQSTDFNNVDHWACKGRKMLLGRIKKLIQRDGSFAQRSMTYHRVALDTMTWVIAMQKRLNLAPFESNVMSRLDKLAEWQYKMTLGRDGDAPNYGSNDGANVGNLNSLDYRDFRGSTQTYWTVANRAKLYNNGLVDETAYWYATSTLDKLNQSSISLPQSEMLDEHNLIIRKGTNTIFLKLPDDKFRPGTDAFHLDLWVNGKCVLRDNGSYSYNASEVTDTFKSSSYHNTLSFDGHEQMPKLSRFLNAKWIKTISSQIQQHDDRITWRGSYTDYKGCTHTRQIELTKDKLLVKDIGKGDAFSVNYHLCESNYINRLESDSQPTKGSSEYSLYYLQKESKPFVSYRDTNEITVTIDLKGI